jgi:hypothetical protein
MAIHDRRYDFQIRALYAEIGFWFLCLSIGLPFVLAIWIFAPDMVPWLPSRFWIAAISMFLCSLVVFAPLLVFFANFAFPD